MSGLLVVAAALMVLGWVAITLSSTVYLDRPRAAEAAENSGLGLLIFGMALTFGSFFMGGGL